MLTLEQALALCDYDAWANRRALDACAALNPEELSRDLRASFRSVHGTLLHILGGQWFWLERWRQHSPTLEAIEGFAAHFTNLAGIRAGFQQVEREFCGFVAELGDAGLARVFHYTTTEGNPNAQPYWQTVQHLVNHGAYHRGQIATLLRQLGKPPVATDFILYCRENGEKLPAAPVAPETVRVLYDYNAWANHRLLDSCGALAGEQFTRDLGSSFPSIRDTLVHILGAEWLWLERWHGRSHTAMPPGWEFPNLGSVAQRWADIEAELLGFVARQSAAELAAVSEYRTTKGVASANPLWQSVLHVVNHGTYHRGQVATLLRQSDLKPNFSDLIFFYRERAGQALD